MIHGMARLIEKPGRTENHLTTWEVWDEVRCLGRFLDRRYAVKFANYARGNRPYPVEE